MRLDPARGFIFPCAGGGNFSRGTGVPGKPGGFAPPILFFLEKENASRPVEEKIAFCRTTGPAGQLAEMRGSSESVPTFNRSLLPSAEYIGCCRDCSAAARRTPAVIVGWKIARPVLLLPRIPLRYALPCQATKARRQSLSNHRGAAAKENGGVSLNFPNFRECQMWLSGPSHQSLPGQTPVTGAASVPGEARNSAASAFSLTPSKGAFSFRRNRKENGGFEAAGLPRHPRPTGRPHSAKEKRRSRAHGRITPRPPLMAKWAKKVRRHPASKRDGGGSGGRRVSGRRSGETGRQRRPGREPRTRGVCPRGRNPACGGV